MKRRATYCNIRGLFFILEFTVQGCSKCISIQRSQSCMQYASSVTVLEEMLYLKCGCFFVLFCFGFFMPEGNSFTVSFNSKKLETCAWPHQSGWICLKLYGFLSSIYSPFVFKKVLLMMLLIIMKSENLKYDLSFKFEN